jgi:AcrR family transcriptional regulator
MIKQGPEEKSKRPSASKISVENSSQKNRPGGRSARVRKAVLEQAYRLLTEKGLSGFSIAEVAACSEINETSIYRRWKTKTGLIMDVCLSVADEVLFIPDTGNLRSDLFEFANRLVSLLRSPQGAVFISVNQATEAEYVQMRRQFWRLRLERMSVVVTRAIDRHELPEDTKPIQLIETLIAPIWFRELVSMEPIEEWPLEEFIDRQLVVSFFKKSSKG